MVLPSMGVKADVFLQCLSRSPQLPVGLGTLSPAGGLWAPDLLRLPASARSPCSTDRGSLTLGFRVWGLGFRV